MQSATHLYFLLFKAAILFFDVKNVLQAISTIPTVADLAIAHRNLTIAYLHMVLVGFISLAAFEYFLKGNENNSRHPVKPGLFLFVIAFILTEILWVLNGAGVNVEVYGFSLPHLLPVISLLFPVAIFLILYSCRRLF